MREGIVAAIVALFVVGCVWTAVQRADMGVLGAKSQAASRIEQLRVDNAAMVAVLEAKIRAGQTLTEVELTFLHQHLGSTTNVYPTSQTTFAPLVMSVEPAPAWEPTDWDDLSFKAWALGVEFDRIERENNAYWAEVARIGKAVGDVQAVLNHVKAELAR